jgi:hypothetical protein
MFRWIGRNNLRDHTKLRAFELADEATILTYDSKLLETEKVLGALIRSLRSPNRLQSKQPE